MTRRMALEHGRHGVGSVSVSAGGVDDRVEEIPEFWGVIVGGVG